MGLRMGDSPARDPKGETVRAEGEGDRRSFGDIGDIASSDEAPAGEVEGSLSEYASTFLAEPESGIARTALATDDTPSGVVLVAEPARAPEDARGMPLESRIDALLESSGSLNVARASLDDLGMLEQHEGDIYASQADLVSEGEMLAGEAASGVLSVVPEVVAEAATEIEAAPQIESELAPRFDIITDLAEAAPVVAITPTPAPSASAVAISHAYAPQEYEPAVAGAEEEERPSTPIARVSISRMMQAVVLEPAPPAGSRRVEIALTVSPALLAGCDEAFVTLTLADGKVVHEGNCNAEGQLTVTVVIPGGDSELRALLDTGSKYKNARIKLSDVGITEYVFR